MSMQQLKLAYSEAARELSIEGELDAEGCATIVSPVPGVPEIHVVYLGGGDAAALVSEIGYVPSDDAALCFEFLSDNFMGQGTGGAVFAADAASGKVMLQRELDAGRIDGAGLAKILANFAEVAFRARRRLVRKAEAGVAEVQEERGN